jgi:hypothetical protein
MGDKRQPAQAPKGKQGGKKTRQPAHLRAAASQQTDLTANELSEQELDAVAGGGADTLNVQPDKSDSSSEEIKQIRIDLP